MTSAVTPHAPSAANIAAAAAASSRSDTTTSPQPGAVPAQPPARSYANATKTATPTSAAPAGASAQNAKSSDASVNGASTAQGGPQGASNTTNNGPVPNGAAADHGRKPSVVISASGTSGYTPNGGPVGQSARPPIQFGSTNQGSPLAQPSVPHQTQANLTPQQNPRVTSPAHSPSPIPQPQASGGRPPSSLQNHGNGPTFGSMAGDGSPANPMAQANMGQVTPMHERRTSSQSAQGGNFGHNGGRGRPFPGQNYNAMASPGQAHRSLPNQPRSNVPAQFQQAPNSPFGRGGNRSPAPQMPPQPHMPQGHMGGNPQMQYPGYPQHMHPQQGMYGMPPANYNPYGGHYDPYYYQQYPNQGPPQSPRQYPSPFNGAANPMQPPFHPTDMSRSASQSSQRPPSSLGQSQTPQQQQATPQAPVPSQSSNFVRPVKKSAIKITDAQGNEVNFAKSTPSPAPSSQGPVIVRTETPPQRVPSATHNRAESKPVNSKTAEETKVAFQEQVKRQLEEEKRRREAEENAAKQPEQTESEKSQKPVEPVVKEAVAEAEKSAAAAAGDKPGEEAAAAAESAVAKEETGEDKTEQEETEEERIEREIAEMEAAEREEEEREKAYQEKRQREKAEAAKRQAELDAKADEELKRQEREAEEREEARERERNAGTEKAEASDDAAKSLFATLKKPALGPGASATTSGADTPTSEDAGADGSMPPPQSSASQSRVAVGAKAKPAHLKLETAKRVEPAEPTPGMQALKSARFLEIKEEAKYPEGIKSPNPALNSTGARKGRAYDRNFLLQFQNVFKEKPSVDWDQKVRETLGGGGDDSGRGGTRTPGGNMGPRTNSRGGQQAAGNFPMGSFVQQPITRGMTSEQRFAISNANIRPGAGIGRVPSGLGLSGPGGISRNNSLTMPNMGGANSRQASSRGKQGGGSKRGPREADLAAKMPLTAHMEIAPLQKSTSGWKPMSIAATPGAPSSIEPDGLMAPDLVQRKVKAALNKMTPEKFDKISDQILEIAGQSKHESDGRTLRQVIQLTFEKACDESHWAGMYAKFCHKMLTSMSPEIRDETIKDKAGNPVVGGALFRKYLLNRCQEEFERGWQANLPDKPEGDESQEAVLLSDEYYVAAAAKRRGLGLIQFIGQLYKLRMLTLRIMHECVMRLLNFEGDPDEAAVENLTTLLKAVGSTMDEEEQGRSLLATYFQRIDEVLLKSDALSSRPKFMIMDLVDLRKAGWKGKDDSKGPKTIEQIHQEAAAAQAKAEAERQRTQRGGPGGGRMPAGRGDARNFSGGMPPPVDYNRTTVGMDDLRRLQNRGASQRSTGGSLGPGGSFGPSTLGARTGSRRGLGPPSSGNTTRTNTPPIGDKEKKDDTQTNAFSALAALDPSGEAPEDAEATSPSARERSDSTTQAEETSTA